MFDHLLESSRRDDSTKWLNIEFGEETDILEMKTSILSGAVSILGFQNQGGLGTESGHFTSIFLFSLLYLYKNIPPSSTK